MSLVLPTDDVPRRPRGKPLTPVEAHPVWEAGHYYAVKGATEWSRVGWELLERLAHPEAARLLFIDDVHELDEVGTHERDNPRIDFNPSSTHTVMESEVLDDAYEVLEPLMRLPKRKRVRYSANKKTWRCSGHLLIRDDSIPTCLFYDLGLTVRKCLLGYRSAVNILPKAYELQQRRLRKVVNKALPGFGLTVILHDLDGNWEYLE
ncbi:hypothetical protein KGQ55_00685 [Patescibacteria group bacterium]|nr:hypothetical protein [Patescibacteria group bacterium]